MKKFNLFIGMVCLPISVSYGTLMCGICKQKGGSFLCRKKSTMLLHLTDKHDFYACPHCQSYVKGGEAYKKHVKDVHNRRACLLCVTHTFENEEAYQSHKDAIHLPSLEYKYLCSWCHKKLPTLERFVIHVFAKHKQYACPDCIKKSSDGENGKEQTLTMTVSKEKTAYLTHMFKKHEKFVCLQCNMQAFKTKEDYSNHCNDCNVCCEVKKVERLCNHCGHSNKFRNKAEQKLHELQHAFLLYFLEQTICQQRCCVPFRKAVADTRKGNHSTEKEDSAIKAVRTLADHISTAHKRCLFCENPVTDASKEVLEKNLASVTYRQIAQDARTFIRLNEVIFSKGEIPVIPCEMCGSALYPNRKSRLFSASIAQLLLGKGLDVQDYPFHHLEYDERKAKKNMLLSVIKEVPANEEESCFIPKKDEKDNVILGEEDEAEDEGNQEEEEDEKEPEMKHGK